MKIEMITKRTFGYFEVSSEDHLFQIYLKKREQTFLKEDIC